MNEEIRVPGMGESITEAEISNILKPSGSAVQESEEVIELETEKVNQLLYAPAAGVVTWNVSVGDTVKIGDVIGTIDTEGVPSVEERAIEAPPAPEMEVGGGARLMQGEFVADLEEKPKPKPPPPRPEPTPIRGERETRTPMSRIRKTIANRLVESLHSAAMLTTFSEVDMSAIIAMRKSYQEAFVEKHGVKLGFMSFFVKAVVEALKLYPAFNSYIDNEEIVHREYYEIGIAVGTERGLVVPVVRDCETLTFPQIEQQILTFAKKAREGGLTIADLQGGGFTITNGGVYGSLLSTPILNPPQVGILGMHKIMERPVVVDGEVVIRPMMYLALSYDHRVVDGKEAVTFLIRIKEVLEDPKSLLFFGE